MQTRRNGTIDVLRYVAAAGIIHFHAAAPYELLTVAALPVFSVLVAFYSVPARPDACDPWPRAWRLIRLWFVWSAIYAALKALDALAGGRPLDSEFAAWMLFAGPSVHLWFLTFAAFCAPFGLAVARLAAFGQRGALLAVGAALILGVEALWLFAGPRWGIPVDQWLSAIPAAAFGFAAAVLVPAGRPVAAALVAAALVSSALAFGLTTKALALTAVGILVLGGFFAATPSTRFTSRIRNVSLGLYLVHPAVMAVLLRLPGFDENRTLLSLATLAVSTAVASLFLDSRVNRWFGLPALARPLPQA